jgi:hypothetical protein
LPGPKALDGIAKALGVSVTDLMPDAPAAAVVEDLPALELRQVAGQPGMAWLRGEPRGVIFDRCQDNRSAAG